MERKMRRSGQLLPETQSIRILKEGKYAVWAVEGDEGYPYAVPVNYVYAEGSVYIHCARQGHKIDSILRNPKCSMCIVEKDDVVPEEFTSYFRSVILFGRASVVEDPGERMKALLLLSDKYSPGENPWAEIERFIKGVCIVRIDIDSVTGKEAIELARMRKTATREEEPPKE